MGEIIKLWEADIVNKHVTADLKAVITDFSKGKNLLEMEERKNITAFYGKNVNFLKIYKLQLSLMIEVLQFLYCTNKNSRIFNI